MEKVCPKCHKVHEDMKDKFCSNCGTKLITREKRKPIPPELRHQILVRDGYRCRECGKSNKETSLEIDHIHPLSKGGPTTEDNLWVLCRECNQAKKDDEWKDDEIEVTRNELANLEDQLTEAKVKLQDSTDEDEIRDYKFKIKKFETEYIPQVTNKLNTLIKEEKELEIKRKKQQEENIRREKLFKDLYIELDGELLLEVCDYYSLTETSNEDNLRILVDMHSKKEIYERINIIKKELKEEAIRKELYDKLYNTMSDDELNLFINEFSMKGTKKEILNELINLFSEDEIELLKIKLIKKEEDRLKAERLVLFNRVSDQLGYKSLRLFANEFSIDNSRSIVVNYLIDNYSEDEINSMKNDLLEKEELRQQEIRREFYDNVCELLDDHDIELFSMEKDLANSKPTVVEYLIDNYSMKEIKKQLSELHIKESKELLYAKLMNSLDRIDFITLHKNNPLIRKYNTREKLLKHLVELHSENEINELLSSNRDSFNQNKNVSEKYLNTNINEGFSSSIARYYGFKEENKKYVMETLINNFTYAEIRFMVKDCRENIGILRSSNNKNLGQDIVRNHLLKVESIFMPDFVYDIINTL